MYHYLPPISLSPILVIIIIIISSLPFSHSWTTTISLQTFIPIPPTFPSTRAGSESLFTPEDDNDQTPGILRSTIWYDGPFPGFPFSSAGPNSPPPGPAPAMLFTTLCTQIAVAQCCRALSVAIGFGPFRGAFQANFVGLEPGTIAGVWGSGQEDALGGCMGDLLETYMGGTPRWTWRDGVVPPRISGASYDRCAASPILTGTGPLLAGLFCSTMNLVASIPKRRKRGGAGTGDTVQESKWAYPDIIVVNGTNFTDGRRGDLIYRDGVGRVLNLTRLPSYR